MKKSIIAKKIFAVAPVKNESDIIESFCRYNLTYCDGMIIKDDGSSDNTKEIIQNLINEGLPIYIVEKSNTTFTMAHKAIDEYGADLIVPLDADEFLYHIDGISPRETLEAMREDVEYQAVWRTYVYEKEPDIKLGFMPNNFTHYRNPEMENPERYERHKKVIASKYLLKTKNAAFVGGSHFLVYSEEYQNSVETEIHQKLVFAHFPIRSRAQVMRKAIPNWIHKWNTPHRAPRDILDVFQLGVLFNEIRNNGEISTDKIKQFSIEYAMLLDFSITDKMSITSRGDLDKLESDLGKKLTIAGHMDVSYCVGKLKLHYTSYKDDGKTFLRAALKEIDSTIMFLSSESDEKSRQLQEITQSLTYNCFLFFDTGNGYNVNEIQSFSFTGNEVEISCQIPENTIAVRFDPVEGHGCVISNLEILSYNGIVKYEPINGFMDKAGNLVFTNTDPQISLHGAVHWLKIKYRILLLSDFAHYKFFDKVLDDYAIYEQEKTALTAERNRLIAERDGLLVERDGLVAERNNLIVTRDGVITERDRLIAERDGFLTSRSWRFTEPLRKFTALIRRNRILYLFAKGLLSLKRNGVKGTMKKVLRHSQNEKEQSQNSPAISPAVVESVNVSNNGFLLAPWARAIQAIPSFVDERENARINLVTDSIEKHSLLGGIATALIIATEYANRCKIPLRIITRTTPVNPLDYKRIMELNGIKEVDDISFYTDYDRDEKGKKNFKLDISKKDLFLATSWWSAMAISKTTLAERFFYVIQEVETFFYPHGDEHFFCSQMMNKSNIDYIVNSKYLFDYFQENVPNIVKNGVYFYPAFSKCLYQNQSIEKKSKYNLFFYARPNNPRNLFYYGIYLLNKAFESGILDSGEWDVYLVGQNVPEVIFNNGYKAVNKSLLDWDQYANFLSTVDLAVSFMYTPHPSYPPYDVACSGGVVVSNACLNKKEFPECKNVLLGDLEEDALFETLEKGIMLAKDIKQRKKNFEDSTIPRSWPDTLKDVLAFMEDKSKNVLS